MNKTLEEITKPIYILLKTFPEQDSRGNQGRLYRVVLPTDKDYDILNKGLRGGD